jgi:transposase InsO family protein
MRLDPRVRAPVGSSLDHGHEEGRAMRDSGGERRRDRWARLRFAIVGPLLAAPPKRGALRAELSRLSQQTWQHPITGEPIRFGRSTLERWYYTARGATCDPVGELRSKLRKDAGRQVSLSPLLRDALRAQYRDHPSWSAQLHADNLAVRVAGNEALGSMPSYTTIRRYLRAQGMARVRRQRGPRSPGAQRAQRRLEQREVRSYEAEYVHGLWHLDFHHGSHGLSQAFQKRGLPRAVLTDNGPAMLAAEVRQGLVDLGVVHETTLPYSPYQNAKQEVFFAQVEGRLLAMLEGVEELTLELLNEATQAWGELEYNQGLHRELGASPLARFREGPDVGRGCPGSDALRKAFRAEVTRSQRRSDGTVSVEGRRFEIPSRYRTLERVYLRTARWDLRTVDLVDPRTGAILAALHPLDKTRNADARRRRLETVSSQPAAPAAGVAPLLEKLMADYAATGLPPAYLPKPHDPEESSS